MVAGGLPVPADLYPFRSHFVQVNGLRLHYVDEGEGPPVVMVHGNPSWSFYYRNLLNKLKNSYRVLAPDHIGMGLSDKPGDDRYSFSLAERVADFTSFMEQVLSEGKVSLVVHDWGGMIALAWAVKHSERLHKLLILNTAAFPLPAAKALPVALWLARDTRFGAWLVERWNAFAWGATVFGVKKAMAPEVQAGYLAPYAARGNRLATLRFVQDIPLGPSDRGYDLLQETAASLPRLASVPTLICWGMKDFVFDHHFLAEWEKRLPGAEIHRFPKAGHYVLEDAGDEIGALWEEFLARG